MTTYNETQVLSYGQVVDELRAIVAEKGYDYVYTAVELDDPQAGVRSGAEQCVYFNPFTGQPSCIVGHWLARHDVLLDDPDEGLYGVLNLGTNIGSLLNDNALPFGVDVRSHMLLEQVQRMQDRGVSWGKALDAAVAFAAGEVSSEDPWELPS